MEGSQQGRAAEATMRRPRDVHFTCAWCGSRISLSATDDVERFYFAHVDWCKQQHVVGSIKRAVDAQTGRAPRGLPPWRRGGWR
jgi:transcription elongation factor Elf1